MSTLTAIVTCHNSTPDPILKNLEDQTRTPDEVLVECSGTCAPATRKHDYLGLVETVQEFGYEKRQRLAEKATSEWLGFFCHDDSYSLDYIKEMMGKAQGFLRPDVVWCPWNDRPGCRFWPCDSTLGNFIIKRDAFLSHGGFARPPMHGILFSPAHPTTRFICDDNHGFRDAMLIDRLIHDGEVRVAQAPELMYFHNVPYDKMVSPTVWGEVHE
jgi:hypothetical protein